MPTLKGFAIAKPNIDIFYKDTKFIDKQTIVTCFK